MSNPLGIRHGPYRLKTHGMSTTPEFQCWWSMRQRCANPNVRFFENYGGRGLTVCERWLTFDNFFSDMGPRPSPNHSIDRVNNDGPYEPGNCRWATRAEQVRNRRDNVLITIGDETRVLNDWAAHFSISPNTVRRRLKLGMDPYIALTTTPDSKRRRSNSGLAGVYEHPGKPRPWQARARTPEGRFKSLGYFATKEDAAEARQRFMVATGAGVPR